MDNKFYNLTSDKLMRAIRWRAIKYIFASILGIFYFGFMGVLIVAGNELNIANLLMIALFLMFLYLVVQTLAKNIRILAAGAENDVFRKYGSPEYIVSVLADPSNVQTINSKQLILTKAYFMQHNNYLSFIPLNAIRVMRFYIRHGRKSSSLMLEVTAHDGTKESYRVDSPLFVSYRTRSESLAAQMKMLFAQYAPHICVES